MDWAKGCVNRYRKIKNLILDRLGKFGVMLPKRRHPHIEISVVVDRGVRGGMVGSGGDRGPSVGLGVSPGKSSGGRRCRAGRWGGAWSGEAEVVDVCNLDCVVPGGGLDSCMHPLVLLHQGPKYSDVLLKATLYGCFGRFGSGKGEVGVLGRGHQELVMLVVFIVC